MPSPIRPVRDTEQDFPSSLMGGIGALSPLQQMWLEEEAQITVKKISRVDVRDAENLHKIWLSNDALEVEASDAGEEILLFVPSDVDDYDLMRLKTNGLVVVSGRRVSPTEKGDKVLRDTILKTPSDLQTNRTREKYRPKSED